MKAEAGSLAFLRKTEEARFRESQAALAAGLRESVGFPVPRRSGRAAYRLLLARLPRTNAWFWPLAPQYTLVLTDPAAPLAVDVRLLAEAYELTPIEAEVVGALARGEAVKEIAAGRGISEVTVRVHQHAVMRKLELASRSDLVATVRAFLTSVPRLPGRDDAP